MECFRLLFDHFAWIEHQFFEWRKRFKDGRESVRDDKSCGRGKEVYTLEFYGAFQKLLEQYNKCIATGGDYFEGN